jgi:hypothetical protein
LVRALTYVAGVVICDVIAPIARKPRVIAEPSA